MCVTTHIHYCKLLYFGSKWPCRDATDQQTAQFGTCHTDSTACFNHRQMLLHGCTTSVYLFKVKWGVNGAELWFGLLSIGESSTGG